MFSEPNSKLHIAFDLFFKKHLITITRFYPFFTGNLSGFQLLFATLITLYHSFELVLGYGSFMFETADFLVLFS
ncbi:hypothetical protein HanHA300_Chr02g0055041 [Helianthus annuus]|nr:hypothetical protein HanHA300_Chr02g0055041 [Helianthus annuus]KAJ0618871.1 hypothetical protein HanHA89_Chr02g0058501 [Helianthus annuus]KAJ0777330.1 hypothetical protein HanLR1_Chr02g0056141 [Helianthus annuus]